MLALTSKILKYVLKFSTVFCVSKKAGTTFQQKLDFHRCNITGGRDQGLDYTLIARGSKKG